MNKQKRKAIDEIVEQLRALYDQLETLQEEEQDCYDNMPESLQYSEKGEAMSAAVDQLDNAKSSVEEAIVVLDEVLNQ